MKTLDPMTGRQISPLTAAALCVKPRGQMTARQIVNVDALKTALAKFTTMRHLAMRFRGLLRGGTRERLDIWLNDAGKCGVYSPGHAIDRMTAFQVACPEADRLKPTLCRS